MQVLRAIGLARGGLFGPARASVARALTEGRDDALVLVASAAVLFVTRDYQRALDCLDRAKRLDVALFDRVIEDQVRYASALGWDREVLDALQLAMDEQPDEPRWFVHATKALVRTGALARALAAASRALELSPGNVGIRLEVATLLNRLGRYEEALTTVRGACGPGSRSEWRYALAIARTLRDAGSFEEARQRFEQVLEDRPEHVGVVLELTELALWSGDQDRARRHIEQARAIEPSHPGIDRAAGIVHMLAGAPEQAAALLDAALERDDSDASTLLWRAEAAYRVGDYAAAHGLLSRATMRADGYLFVAWMLRQLVVSADEADAEDQGVKPFHIEEFRDAVAEIVPEAPLLCGDDRRPQLVQTLETALERMRGNRTTTATFVDERGVLTRVRSRSGVRFASRHALQLIRALPPAQVIEALDEIVARHPEASLPVCHRGELYLWLGDLARARSDLEQALQINPYTRWAYIGLTGIDILQGRPEDALSTSAHGVLMMGNTEGPAVFAYRGEAHRLVGHAQEARADLEKAVEITPTRIAAWVDLALLHLQVEDIDAFDRAWAHIEAVAPGLLSDAAAEMGIILWERPNQVVASREQRRRVLEHALGMMRGNRSTSCATYFTAGGLLRFVQPQTVALDGGPHAADERVLDRARSLLGGQGELLRRRTTVSRPARHVPTTLTRQQIEHYLTHGYVVLPKCFSKDLAARWVEEANRRIAEEPERWVEGYDVADPTKSLRGYDPSDPRSWTWSRISLHGPRQVPIDAFSARLWGALCDLLGGEHRIATKTLSDYFVVNLRSQAVGDPRPGPGRSAWHIDAPSRRTTLQGFDNGAVVISLFSDLLPGSGGTWLAVDSVPHVARLLAEHPEGVDFVDREAAPALTHHCRRFEEVTGEAGDVLVLHPFMIHAGAQNPTTRIRWMGNPNIRLASPLRIDRPDPADHSPVEEAVRRALGMSEPALR